MAGSQGAGQDVEAAAEAFVWRQHGEGCKGRTAQSDKEDMQQVIKASSTAPAQLTAPLRQYHMAEVRHCLHRQIRKERRSKTKTRLRPTKAVTACTMKLDGDTEVSHLLFLCLVSRQCPACYSQGWWKANPTTSELSSAQVLSAARQELHALGTVAAQDMHACHWVCARAHQQTKPAAWTCPFSPPLSNQGGNVVHNICDTLVSNLKRP